MPRPAGFRGDVGCDRVAPDAPPALHTDPDLTDLQNTMTHEFGHFIGLAHSCYRPAKDPAFDVDGNPRPLDDKGKPVVACGDSSLASSQAAVTTAQNALDTARAAAQSDQAKNQGVLVSAQSSVTDAQNSFSTSSCG